MKWNMKSLFKVVQGEQDISPLDGRLAISLDGH